MFSICFFENTKHFSKSLPNNFHKWISQKHFFKCGLQHIRSRLSKWLPPPDDLSFSKKLHDSHIHRHACTQTQPPIFQYMQTYNCIHLLRYSVSKRQYVDKTNRSSQENNRFSVSKICFGSQKRIKDVYL